LPGLYDAARDTLADTKRKVIRRLAKVAFGLGFGVIRRDWDE
jgi:hypothetical protein